MTDIRQVNEALETLKKKAVQTSQGSYVRLRDVEKLMKDRVEVAKEELQERKDRGKIKTVEQARAAVKRDEELMEFFEGKGSLEPGRAVPPGPPPVVEDVKA
jgi:hypothetical protein